MMRRGKPVRNIRHILLMCFVLFALSPCIVKEALFGAANTTYAKTLNKSKTTAPFDTCSYSQSNDQQIAVSKQLKVKQQIDPVAFVNPYFIAQVAPMQGRLATISSGNSPPRYILYKRLRLDVA